MIPLICYGKGKIIKSENRSVLPGVQGKRGFEYKQTAEVAKTEKRQATKDTPLLYTGSQERFHRGGGKILEITQGSNVERVKKNKNRGNKIFKIFQEID